jgi:hypothetical protein
LKEVRNYNSKGVEFFVEYRLSRVFKMDFLRASDNKGGNSLNSTCDSTQFLEELKSYITINAL